MWVVQLVSWEKISESENNIVFISVEAFVVDRDQKTFWVNEFQMKMMTKQLTDSQNNPKKIHDGNFRIFKLNFAR